MSSVCGRCPTRRGTDRCCHLHSPVALVNFLRPLNDRGGVVVAASVAARNMAVGYAMQGKPDSATLLLWGPHRCVRRSLQVCLSCARDAHAKEGWGG